MSVDENPGLEPMVAASVKPKTSRASKAAQPAAAQKTSKPRAKAPASAAKSKASQPALLNTKVSSISGQAEALRKLDFLVRVSGLAKRYQSTQAVDTIDFNVPRGSLFGIVGPNGAGKTTTLMMMSGLLKPDTGRVVVGDYDVWTDSGEANKIIGVMPDRLALYDRLTGWQLVFYTASLRGLDKVEAKANTDRLLEKLGIQSAANRLVSDYSAGMIKKLALACALVHSPKLLILDEPFETMDRVSVKEILKFLKELTETGLTVILSSHDMELVEANCEYLAVIVSGRVIDQGPIAEVIQGRSLRQRFTDLVGQSSIQAQV